MYVRKGLDIKSRQQGYYNYNNFWRYSDTDFLNDSFSYCVNGKYYIRDTKTRKIIKVFDNAEDYENWQNTILNYYD